MYEGSSRVPMILSGPGVPCGITFRGLTQLVDVYPTLLTIFGLDPSAAGVSLDGASLLDANEKTAHSTSDGTHGGARKFVVSQYHSNRVNTGTVMVRTSDGLKYVAFGTSPRGLETAAAGYAAQLFDVEHDPDELSDLAPAGQHDLAPYEEMLHARVGDHGGRAAAKTSTTGSLSNGFSCRPRSEADAAACVEGRVRCDELGERQVGSRVAEGQEVDGTLSGQWPTR